MGGGKVSQEETSKKDLLGGRVLRRIGDVKMMMLAQIWKREKCVLILRRK